MQTATLFARVVVTNRSDYLPLFIVSSKVLPSKRQHISNDNCVRLLLHLAYYVILRDSTVPRDYSCQ